MKLRIIAGGLSVLLLLAGCGNRMSETVEEYGGGNGKTENSVSGLETFSRTRWDEQGNVYEETFAVGNVPVEMHLQSVTWDMDQVLTRRMCAVTKESIQENKLVKAFFGDTGTKVERNLETEDPYELREMCEGFQRVFCPQDVTVVHDNSVTAYEYNELISWRDGADFFYHTWEGKHDGVDYWLFLGYREDIHSEYIRFYPKNPGELIDDASHNRMERIKSKYEDRDYDTLKGKKNRTQKNDTSLKEMVSAFDKDVLQISIPLEDMSFVDPDESREIVCFLPDQAMSDNRYEDAVVDGYRLRSRGMHFDYGVDFTGENSFAPADDNMILDNQSTVYVHDAGVICGEYLISYLPVETEQSSLILSFDEMLSAFRNHLKDNLDLTDANGRILTCNSMQLVYYPIPSEEDPLDVTYVPTWRIELRWNGSVSFAMVYLNAVDGTLATIEYSEK